MKEILTIIKNNKRIKILTISGLAILLFYVIGVAYGAFTNNQNRLVANIKVNDLTYNLKVNEDENVHNAGELNDKIIRSEAGKTQVYKVSLISLNNIVTKYILTYNYCSSYDSSNNTCVKSEIKPDDLKVYYSADTIDPYNGTILAKSANSIKLVVKNETENDVYLELALKAGYEWNALVSSSSYDFDVGDEGEFAIPYQDVKVLAYVDGIEVQSGIFPSTGFYDCDVTCVTKDGEPSIATATAYWTGSRWTIDILNAEEATICNANFLTNNNPYPIFQFLINGVDYSNDTTKVVVEQELGNYKISFLTSGTFVFSYPNQIKLDIFAVGGGGGGAGGACYNGGGGGGGGYTNTYHDVVLYKNTNYDVVVGAGGTGSGGTNYAGGGLCGGYGTAGPSSNGGNGGQSYFVSMDYGALGGNGGIFYYQGGAGGAGGSGGGGGGGWNQPSACANGGTDGGTGGQGSGSARPAGGNGQGTTTREFGEPNGKLYSTGGGAGATGGANTGNGGSGGTCQGSARNGGSGIIIIRNTRH